MKQLKKIMLTCLATVCFTAQAYASNVPEVKWDSKSLIINGQRVVPVMGEVHFSRIPAEEWKEEVKKMKKYHNFAELLETNDTWEVK